MKCDKRQWIYEGLAIPAGLAVARRQTRRPAARSVFLVGGVLAEGLAPPLLTLAADSSVPIAVDARPDAGPVDWQPWGPQLPGSRPNVVLIALEPDASAPYLDHAVRRSGAQPLWLTRRRSAAVSNLPAEALHIPLHGDRMTPTVAGYAAWAAHCWRMIR